MHDRSRVEHVHTLVIGGGQAGLSVGYHLARRGVPHLILNAHPRIGDSWRTRWDSLRLFTPARFAGLDGMPFPAPPHSFPTKDAFADYLEAYARHFDLPVRSDTKVDRLARIGDRFVATSGGRRFEADQVVIAMSNYQRPRTPPWATELAPGIVQLHSAAYRNPDQLRPGPVLIAGAGNSGAEIAVELASRHEIWMAGPNPGEIPFRIDSRAGRAVLVRLVLRGMFHRVLCVANPLGRRLRPRFLFGSGPLVRTRSADLARVGVRRVGRVTGVRDGRPLLDDGRALEVANVVWCTGYHPGFSWIDLPILDSHGLPQHDRGIVTGQPGLYVVGLHYLYALSSEMIHGVGRDAARIAGLVARRTTSRAATTARQQVTAAG